MAFDPSSIKKGAKKEPRKVVIYGPPKTGKSTLCSAAPHSLMIPTEDRIAHIQADKTEVVSSYDDVLSVFDYLLNGQHTYKRVVIDTLDELEPLLHKAICAKNGWKSLVEDSNKETNFQKGLMYHATDGWRKFLHNCDKLRMEAGLDVILVAHAQTLKINPPDHDSYDKWAMKIDKWAIPIVEGWSDLIGFYDREMWISKTDKQPAKTGKVISSGERILHLSGDSAAMVSCNSYGFSDIKVPEDQCADIMEWLLTGPYDENQTTKTNKKGEK
jgi:hypothetical protein